MNLFRNVYGKKIDSVIIGSLHYNSSLDWENERESSDVQHNANLSASDDNTPEKWVDIKIKALTGYSIVFLFVQKIDDPLKFNFVGQLGWRGGSIGRA